MSVLIIGADEINPIKAVLNDLGAGKITHWDARKKSSIHRKVIPQDTDCIVLLTSFLNHNSMKYFKKMAKKKSIPLVCSKRSVSCVHTEYCKIMKLEDEFGCRKAQNL